MRSDSFCAYAVANADAKRRRDVDPRRRSPRFLENPRTRAVEQPGVGPVRAPRFLDARARPGRTHRGARRGARALTLGRRSRAREPPANRSAQARARDCDSGAWRSCPGVGGRARLRRPLPRDGDVSKGPQDAKRRRPKSLSRGDFRGARARKARDVRRAGQKALDAGAERRRMSGRVPRAGFADHKGFRVFAWGVGVRVRRSVYIVTFFSMHHHASSRGRARLSSRRALLWNGKSTNARTKNWNAIRRKMFDADHLPRTPRHPRRSGSAPGRRSRARADVSSSGRALRIRAPETTRERGALRDDGFRRGGCGSRRSARRRSCARGGSRRRRPRRRCGDDEHREGGMTRRARSRG